MRCSLLAMSLSITVLCSSFGNADEKDAGVDQPVDSLSLVVNAIGQSNESSVRRSLLRGLLAGLEGRRNVKAPAGWELLRQELAADSDSQVQELSMQLSQVFGDSQAAKEALAILSDSSADSVRRRSALHSLLEQQNKTVSARLESLLDDPSLAIDAIRGYASIENAAAPAILFQRFPAMTAAQKRATVETMAARMPYAERLVGAVKRKVVARDDIPVHVARSLSEMLGDKFVKVYGEIRPVADDRAMLLKKYKAMLTPKAIVAADAGRGRVIFDKTCAACHKLYGNGGEVGPDLTGSNRANLDYILLNSIDPSYDVPDAYKMVQILTSEGRVINGVLAEEDNVKIVLKTAEQPRVVIAKADIETRRVSKKSMMPDGQLDQLKPNQVVDLIKYLRTKSQVELSK
ncbi:c-type cytochrome [Stieleria marina]